MKRRSLTVIPLLAALLACRNGPSSTRTTAQAEPGPATVGATRTPPNGGTPEPANAAAPAPAGQAKTGTTTAEPSGPAVALPVVIGHTRANDGFVKIPGEIHNNTKSWMRFVEAHITLLDASGKPINVRSVAAAEGRGEGVFSRRSLVPPGEIAPFEYVRDMDKLAHPYASFKLYADGVPTNINMGATLKDVNISHDDLGDFTVTGSVVSTGAGGCRSPHAVVGLYAADGKLWDLEDTVINSWFQKVMPKGQSVAFKRGSLDDSSGTAKSVKAWADCEL